MATKKDKTASKKSTVAKAGKPSAKAVKKPAADGVVGDVHEKVQLWKDGPYWATTNIVGRYRRLQARKGQMGGK